MEEDRFEDFQLNPLELAMLQRWADNDEELEEFEDLGVQPLNLALWQRWAQWPPSPPPTPMDVQSPDPVEEIEMEEVEIEEEDWPVYNPFDQRYVFLRDPEILQCPEQQRPEPDGTSQADNSLQQQQPDVEVISIHSTPEQQGDPDVEIIEEVSPEIKVLCVIKRPRDTDDDDDDNSIIRRPAVRRRLYTA